MIVKELIEQLKNSKLKLVGVAMMVLALYKESVNEALIEMLD